MEQGGQCKDGQQNQQQYQQQSQQHQGSKMQQWVSHKKVRVWVPPIAGFLFYGGWALLANSGLLSELLPEGTLVNAAGNAEGGHEAALIAGLTQGSYSFTVTLLLALIVEGLFQRLSGWPLRSVWVFCVAFVVLVSTSAGVNIMVGTPNVALTILPGLVVSSLYTVVYILALRRIHRRMP